MYSTFVVSVSSAVITSTIIFPSISTTTTVSVSASSRASSVIATETSSTVTSTTITATATPILISKMVPSLVPDVTINNSTININGNNVTLTLSWGEPFNNFDPIVNYTVSCFGDAKSPPNFTTTDNTTRSYTITNLTTMTIYTFSVVATNSIGSGEAGVEMITTPSGKLVKAVIKFYNHVPHTYVCT